MAYAGRNNIYDGVIRKMVTQTLEAQEAEFKEEHRADTDEQLLDYLRSQALALHHVPWPGEILGGTVIAERFGSWDLALRRAGLSAPQGENKSACFARVQQEEERQKEIYRCRKAEKKQQAEKRRNQQAARKKAAQKKE